MIAYIILLVAIGVVFFIVWQLYKAIANEPQPKAHSGIWQKGCLVSARPMAIAARSLWQPCLVCGDSAGPLDVGDYLYAGYVVDEPNKPLAVRHAWFQIIGDGHIVGEPSDRVLSVRHVKGGEVGDVIPAGSPFINFGQHDDVPELDVLFSVG